MVLVELGIINKIRMDIIYPLINIHNIISFHCRTWRDIICMDRRLRMDMLLMERLVW